MLSTYGGIFTYKLPPCIMSSGVLLGCLCTAVLLCAISVVQRTIQQPVQQSSGIAKIKKAFGNRTIEVLAVVNVRYSSSTVPSRCFHAASCVCTENISHTTAVQQ